MTSPFQTLECRRLLSFTIGGETVVAGGVVDPVVDAVADDGRVDALLKCTDDQATGALEL